MKFLIYAYLRWMFLYYILGGVGKTTTAASFAYGLADKGFKTVAMDFDIGLRNLDIHLGCERRVIFDFVNVLQKECTMNQALIKDKRNPNLYILAASQTKDKTILTEEGVGEMLEELREKFDYIVCDSPAGIESGAKHAMYFCGEHTSFITCLESLHISSVNMSILPASC